MTGMSLLLHPSTTGKPCVHSLPLYCCTSLHKSIVAASWMLGQSQSCYGGKQALKRLALTAKLGSTQINVSCMLPGRVLEMSQ
jgi:hypothetical protein